MLQPPSVRPKTVRTVQLACSPQEAEARLESVGRAGSAALKRRQAILRFLIREALAGGSAWVYAASGGSLQDLQKLEEDGLVMLGENETWRDPLERLTITLSEPPEPDPGPAAGLGAACKEGLQQACTADRCFTALPAARHHRLGENRNLHARGG